MSTDPHHPRSYSHESIDSAYSRRDILRTIGLGGLGGLASITTPSIASLLSSSLSFKGLSSLLSHQAWAQEMRHPPRRFLFVIEGNGLEPVTLLSDPARAALEATLSQPLEGARWWYQRYRHQQTLSVSDALISAPALTHLGDLEGEATVVLGLSSRIAGGGHSALHGVLASARSTGGAPGGITIDAWLAQQDSIRGDSPYDAVRLGVGVRPDRPLDFGTCAYQAGRAAPLMLKPTQAYQALFGSVADEQGAAAFARSGRQLDVVIEDVQSHIRNLSTYPRERTKLEAYLTALESRVLFRERVLALGEQLSARAPTAPVESDDAHERFRQQLNLAEASLISGLTNVCVVGCGTGNDFNLSYPSTITRIARHDLHHGSDQNQDYLDALHLVTQTQLDMVFDVARRLRATPDISGGNMLDHTLIIYLGDNGEQHHSTASEFPLLLLGGRGMGRSGLGQTLIYPGLEAERHRQLSNLWNTFAYLGSAPLNHFGEEGRTRRALGPLTELLG